MNDPTETFRRRSDGILELLPRLDPAETARRAEITIAVFFMLIGVGAVLVRNVAMAVLLLAGGAALLAPRLVREYAAARAERRYARAQPEQRGSDDGPRRIVRLGEYVTPELRDRSPQRQEC